MLSSCRTGGQKRGGGFPLSDPGGSNEVLMLLMGRDQQGSVYVNNNGAAGRTWAGTPEALGLRASEARGVSKAKCPSFKSLDVS